MMHTGATQQGSTQAGDKNAVRPFHVNFPDAELTELRRRINATRWPERETVTDDSQGVQLATTQKLARYWATEHDWRKVEARLNALPQFITNIDGLDIHFIHVQSKHKNALPLIVTHGWPGSVIEQLKIVEPLADPTGHGGSGADAFHVVIPSMPGYGFQLGLRPQSVLAIADSPVGLATYLLDHDARSYELIARVFRGEHEGLTRDDVLDNITLTWLTNTAISSSRLYWENKFASFW